MQGALAGAKRLECGGLPPLCSYAKTTCLSPCRVIRKTPFACFAFFVVETNQNHRVLPRKSGRLHHSITPSPQISPPDRTTAPKDSFRGEFRASGLHGHCINHETHEIHENGAVMVRAFSPSIVESDVEMALFVGLHPTLLWTAPLALR